MIPDLIIYHQFKDCRPIKLEWTGRIDEEGYCEYRCVVNLIYIGIDTYYCILISENVLQNSKKVIIIK